jgi:hypothetical protein
MPLDEAIVSDVAAYEDAVIALHQARFADFVAERKRLAAELKAGGDKEGAARLAKLPRPPVSAWVVNQLWWKERRGFEQLVTLAARVKAGEREASKAHREQLSHLRERAAELLQEAGNAAGEATLRRVTMTLSAIAAQGDFEPDAPGALSADRDPPGFEALGSFAAAAAPAPARSAPEKSSATAAAEARREEAESRRLEAERRRAEEEERKRRLVERERLSGALRDARALEKTQQREQSRLQRELDDAEQALQETRALLDRLEKEIASL